MKVREHAKQLPKELIKDITLKSAERSLLSTHDGSHFSPKQSPEQYASDRLEEGIKWSASKGETIVSQGSKKAAKKKAEKTWRVIKERRSKNADRTAEQSRNSGTQGNSQTERQTDIRIKTKEAVNKRTAGVARENIAEVKNATPLRDSANRIKQAHTAKTSKEASKLKKQAEHAYRSGKKLAVQGKKAATQSAKAAKRTVSGIKTAVKTGVTAVKSLGTFLVAGGWIVVLLVIVLGVIGGIAGSSGSTSAEPLSQEVLAYTSTIQRYASQYGISEYVPSIQAIMMQESGGRGTDPMQASECPYNTRYPNSPGAIQDPEYSIQVGVQYYADCVRQAGCESPLDISRLQLSWQGYNYGNGYIGWALEHHGGYSLENALQFSQEKAAELGWPRYGDPQYVPHVQRYYSGGGILPFMLYEVMQQYIKKNHIHANDYVFQAEQGGAYRIGSFVKRFRTQCKKHKIADCEYVFKTHDYRHTLATQFYDDGVPIQTIRDYLGHVAEEMTKQYVDYMPKKIEKANDNYFDKPENNIALTITPKKRRYRHEKG